MGTWACRPGIRLRRRSVVRAHAGRSPPRQPVALKADQARPYVPRHTQRHAGVKRRRRGVQQRKAEAVGVLKTWEQRAGRCT